MIYCVCIDSFATYLGHGAPAILSCLWLEEALACFWPRYSRDRAGLTGLITKFSTPGGFPRCVLHDLHLFEADFV